MSDSMPELSKSHPLHEDFDFLAFVRKNEKDILNLRSDSKRLTEDTAEAAIIVCSAICSDMTSVSAGDLPLPRPSVEPYLNRFVVFVENMERYLHCLYLEDMGYMRRTDEGFEPTDKADDLVNKATQRTEDGSTETA
mgnify:CR=1 FL=1|tara:strand:- start:12697 stop:13107 length:411 start_codon:yes stop_codon:yes gene_type:complete